MADPSPLLTVSPSECEFFADMYPQRRGKDPEFSWWESMLGHSMGPTIKGKCELAVLECIETMPMVRTMIGALKASGCPIELDRHIACDMCPVGTDRITDMGGYDDQNNQVFLCANNVKARIGDVHGVLVRNLIHAFDRCTAKVDFKNVDHLACMEIRKANLTTCHFMAYFSRSDADWAVKNQHSKCVKSVAVEHMVRTKFVDERVAAAAVDKVFDRCYADLEPYGRRAYDEGDIKRANKERYLVGYD